MFQDPWTGYRPFLGDVADQKDRGVGLLGKAHQLRRTLPDLADGTRRRLQRIRKQRLDGIDHNRLRLLCRHDG